MVECAREVLSARRIQQQHKTVLIAANLIPALAKVEPVSTELDLAFKDW